MNFTTKLWLTAMLTTEIEETEQNIKNYHLWRKGCNNLEEIPAYDEQIENLCEYKTTLTTLLEQVEGGTLNV
jgi:hypothetical protein